MKRQSKYPHRTLSYIPFTLSTTISRNVIATSIVNSVSPKPVLLLSYLSLPLSISHTFSIYLSFFLSVNHCIVVNFVADAHIGYMLCWQHWSKTHSNSSRPKFWAATQYVRLSSSRTELTASTSQFRANAAPSQPVSTVWESFTTSTTMVIRFSNQISICFTITPLMLSWKIRQ